MAKNRFDGMTCYACNQQAIGVEHAPPQGCFPKNKRQNPITVPACAKHNQNKSMEDELIKAVVVLSNDGSPDAMEVLESVIRAMEKDEGKMKVFMPSPKVIQIDGRETAAFQINVTRFNQSISMIVQALWFAERRETLSSQMDVQWSLLQTSKLRAHPIAESLQRIENAWSSHDYKGTYPEVFRYDFHECPPHNGLVYWVCRLCFYSGTPIIVTWTVER